MSITHHSVLQFRIKCLFSACTQITRCHGWKLQHSKGTVRIVWMGTAVEPCVTRGVRACARRGVCARVSVHQCGLVCPRASGGVCACPVRVTGVCASLWVVLCCREGSGCGAQCLQLGARCPVPCARTRCCGPASPCTAGRARMEEEGGMGRDGEKEGGMKRRREG